MPTAKPMFRLLNIPTLLVAVACARGTVIERPPGEPTQAVNQVLSLASPSEIKQRSEFAQTKWIVVEDSKTLKSSSHSRFDNYVMTADNYRVGSVKGELRVEFLNGMLLATSFYPDDLQKCVDELARAGVVFPTEIRSREDEVVSAGDTDIWLGKDYRGRRYIRWEDRRLVDEMNKWLMRNS